MKHSFIYRTIKKVIKENLLLTIGFIVMMAATVLLSLIPPQLLRRIIDTKLLTKEWKGLFVLALCYLFVLILNGICDFAKAALLAVFGQKMMTDLRIGLNEKLMQLPTPYYSTHSTGEISSVVMNDVANVNSLFADGVMGMITDCFKIIGILVSIFLFSIRLGFLVLCMIPVIYGITRTFQKRMLKAQVSNLKQLGLVNGHISDTLRNASMIKCYSKEAYMEQLYQNRIDVNFRTVDKVNYYDSIYSPIIQVLRAVLISLVVVLASKQLDLVGITLGMAAASIELISNLFAPIEALGMELQNIQRGISGGKRLNAFDQIPEEVMKDDTVNAEDIIAVAKDKGLRFQNVSFAYEPQENVFENLNVEIPFGTCVTFVGRTGAGKTTLFRLIMGLLTPTQGEILLGNTKVSDIPNREKRKLFGYVEQQFKMINGTIADQISLKDPSITKLSIRKALDFVGLSEYIDTLEQKEETILTRQSMFSQGQLQLLSIARAIVLNPPILLLDEITANLDSATEARIVKVLQKAQQGRTVLSISHRLTAVLSYDQLIQM